MLGTESWKLADAKNRFSELVRLALSQGPQYVTRRDKYVVVLAGRDYEALTGARPGFKAYLSEGPDFDGLDLMRDSSSMRDTDL